MKRMIILTGLCFCLLSQKAISQIDIYLKDYGFYVNTKNCHDSTVLFLADSSFVKIKFLNCKGKMRISEFSSGGILVATGQYESSLDTLKQYMDKFNLSGEIIAIKVHKYFQPLRDGMWTFYDKGIVTRHEKYKRGVLLSQ